MAKFPVGIEHVVVLCLENRSFDHMLGFLDTPRRLTGDEFNLTDPEDPSSTRVNVSNTAAYVGDLDVDPSHEVTQVREQLYGAAGVPRARQGTQRRVRPQLRPAAGHAAGGRTS